MGRSLRPTLTAVPVLVLGIVCPTCGCRSPPGLQGTGAEGGEGSWDLDSSVHWLCSLSLSLAPEGEGNLDLGVLYSSGIKGGL